VVAGAALRHLYEACSVPIWQWKRHAPTIRRSENRSNSGLVKSSGGRQALSHWRDAALAANPNRAGYLHPVGRTPDRRIAAQERKRPPGRDTGRPLARLPAPGLLRFRRDCLGTERPSLCTVKRISRGSENWNLTDDLEQQGVVTRTILPPATRTENEPPCCARVAWSDW
jgi:hypothetical protein